jgi:DNA-binding FrmR family transcriptional regulator
MRQMTENTGTINRLRRVEGQVRGVIKMLEEERYCIDVLHQVQAVKSALARAENEILKDHAASCVESAIASGDSEAQREKVSELVDLFERLKR